MPDLVVMTDASYSQPLDGLGALRDSIPSIKWQRVSCSGVRLGVPWETAPFYVRFAGKLWYGAATIRSAKARTVWFSLEANDFAKLWINDQLVWTDIEKVWRYRPNARAFLPVKLQAGDNRLLTRVHNDRKMAWLRMALTTKEPATPPLPARTQAYANPNIFPDANPPLAWDIEKGINVAWRNAALAGSSRPVLAGDALLVADTNGSLRCLDIATGKERWSTQPGKDPESNPITNGKLVWFHCGALACYDLTGKQAWTRETGLAQARAYVSGNLLVVEGQTAVTTRGAVGTLRVITFDAGSGQEKNRWDLPGRFDNKGVLLTSGGAAVFLTSEGSLLDLTNGRELPAPDIEMQCSSKDGRPASNITQWVYVFSRNADMFFLTSQERHQAVRFWAKDGKLAFAHAWESNYGHSGFGNVFSPAVATDKFLFTTHSVLAHTPHSPDPRAEINVQDVKTGRVLKRLKPAMDDLYSYGALNLKTPTIAGPYLFLLGGRNQQPGRNQIAVVTADEQLQLVASNDVDPGTSATPVFSGNRMILRSPTALTCIAVTTDEGRKHQNMALAKTLLRYIGQPPQTAKPQAISGLEKVSTAGDIPVGVLRDQRTTEFWLGAGPLSEEKVATLRLPDTNGLAFTPLDRDHAYNEPTMYLRTSELQGTGDITPHFKSALDPRGNAGPEGVGIFYTVLENSRDRVVVPAIKAIGVSQWLSGQELKDGQPLYLKAGLYPYLVKVSPEYFKVEGKVELPGVLITNALAAGALKDIGWPKSWKVFGPFPSDAPPLTADQLRDIPGTLTVGETEFTPYDVPVTATTNELNGHTFIDDNSIQLIALSETVPGRKPDLANAPKKLNGNVPLSAYLFATVDCPADGYLYINAGADWYMQWFVDGEPLHDGFKEGKTGQVDAHRFTARVKKGRHVVAVLVKPGDTGWQVTSLGAFSEKSPDRLPEFRVAPPPKPAVDIRLNPSFREIPHPPTLGKMWRDRVTRNADRLQAIVRDLPDSDEAKIAAAILTGAK
jgi:outer membrane protein assembly factor BamB